MRKLMVIGILSLSLVTWAAVSMAGPGCGANKQTKGCSQSTAKTCQGYKGATAGQAALEGIEVQTSRLPSGALLVFYRSDVPTTVAALHQSAIDGANGFDCRLCQKIAADKDSNVELGILENGVVALVTAADPVVVDRFEQEFAALIEPTDK